MRIAILYGALKENARPDEADSLVQAEMVSGVLSRQGHRLCLVEAALDLAETARQLSRFDPDLVFNLVDDIQGRGELIHLAPSLLDQLALPYTGAGAWALYATSNKPLAKRLMVEAGLPTPDWITKDGSGRLETDRPGTMIVKSVWDHGSVGLDADSLVRSAKPEAIHTLLEGREGEWFAESYIEGREFNAALLQDGPKVQVLPLSEIEFVGFGPGQPRVVDYRAKWDESSFEYHHTPRRFGHPASDRGLLRRLAELAQECWRVFELRGYARVDFRVDKRGRPWILEINANPCLSPDAGFMATAKRAGLNPVQVVDRLVSCARTDREDLGWSRNQELKMMEFKAAVQ